MTALELQKKKIDKQKISMVTCYDFWSAQMIERTPIDCILVGDSLAMVMHGFNSTLPATPEMMAHHTAAVARGAPTKFIVGDMPFLSFRKGIAPALDCVALLMQAGAHAVKLEGVDGHEDVVTQIVKSGVPVMGHLGLTPQSVHQLGGYKVQARTEQAARILRDQAQRLESLGCFSLVLECIPTEVAKAVTESLSIPVIGIGAGPFVDGQVLVLQDLLGLQVQKKPKFVRQFAPGAEVLESALKSYDQAVKSGTFPSPEESYS